MSRRKRSTRGVWGSAVSQTKPAETSLIRNSRFATSRKTIDHYGRRQRAQPSGIFKTGAAHQTEQESGGEQVAGAGGVHDLVDRKRRHRDDAVFRGHHATSFA